jgi:tetratricopeptide (TPR) repeat protein
MRRLLPLLALTFCPCTALPHAGGPSQQDRSSTNRALTLGVVVGISNYSQNGVNRLQFADKDAEGFYGFLLSRRGGASAQNVALLLDGRATLDSVRTAIKRAFDTAKESDTVILFLAGHGIAMDHGPNRGAYILAVNSNPENLPATALRMEELQSLTSGSLKPRNVRVFVDACHSGVIGSIVSRNFNRFATDLLDDKSPVVFGLMASRFKELSYECTNYGHGAFTYFLLRGLNTTEAIDARSRRITTDSLNEFVRAHVRSATNQKQNPEAKGGVGDRLELADVTLPGVNPPGFVKPETCVDSRGRDSQAPVATEQEEPSSSDPFSDALRRGEILPGKQGSAFEMLMQRSDHLNPQYLADRDRLVVALENAGQQVILDYLRGEEVPQTRDEFQKGEKFFSAASLLSPGDPFIESRRLFCRGRQLIFDRKYVDAIKILENSIRLFPPGAYSNTAIGIAYLETADFQRAIAAFRDAVQLAPYWAYARHNLALALTQAGQYADAISTYRSAMALVPHYAYIPYNLGLLMQRLNRPQEARQAWEDSIAISPRMARAWNAIGLSHYLEHRYDASDREYRKALDLASDQTDRLVIRHDLALLFVAQKKPDEAIRLWRLNLADKPDDLPSLIGLSDVLIARGQTEPALQTLAALVQSKPDYLGARLQYAKVLFKAAQPHQAAEQLQEIIGSSSENSEVYELLADARAQTQPEPDGRSTAAVVDLYNRALELATSRQQRNRIRHKLQPLLGSK